MELEFNDKAKPFTLKGYQQEAVIAVEDCFREGLTPLVDMATGTGKTIVFSSIMKRNYLRDGGNSLAIAHRDELVSQAMSKIYRQTEILPEREQGNDVAKRRSPFVVGSVQTLQNKRLSSWPKDYFNLVVIDEGHHSVAKTYKNVINHFESKLIGVSATWDRYDKQAFTDIYDKVAYSYPLYKAIIEKNLAPIVGEAVKDFDIDLDGLKVVRGDYNENELGDLLKNYFSPIAHNIKLRSHGLKTLVFMPNVESARLMAAELAGKDMRAKYVHGGNTKQERKRILYDFHAGNITHLCSCDLLIEGFDEPGVEALVILRPTPSRSLFSQIVGRGTRLHPGKENVKLIEFTFNSTKLSLASTFDLFAAAGYEEKVRELAAAGAGENIDYLQALQDAHAKYYSKEFLLERLVNKEYNFIKFDPFAAAELAGADIRGEFDIKWEGRLLEGQSTQKQGELLNRYGIYEPQKLSKAQASVLIDSMTKLCVPMAGEVTDGQLWKLKKLGVNGSCMMKAQASIMIEQLLAREKERSEKMNSTLQF